MPKVKVGNDNSDGVAGQNTYSAHVGGGSMSFDSDGDLYIGTGDDVDPFGAGGNGYAPMDQRYPQRYDARNTSANTNDLRGKILRIHPLANASGAAGAGTTYSIPTGNMFAPGTANTKPEIFAMGFRNPFTVQADPAHPGTVVVGEYGPDAGDQQRHARPGRRDRVEPRHQARLLRLAAVRGRQLGRQQLLPLHVPERPVRRPLRLLGGADPQRVAEQHRPDRTSPARPSAPTSGTSAPASIPRASRSRPGRARRSRSPARSTTTTPPTRRRRSGRPTTTAPGSSSTAPRTGGARRASRTTAAAILRVNGLFGSSQFGSPSHTYPIPVKFGPDGSLYMATWGFDCCRAQLPDQRARPADAGRLHRRRGGHHRAGGRRGRHGHAATAPATTSAARR